LLPSPPDYFHSDACRPPNVYSYPYYPTSGGLASHGPDPVDDHRRAAVYVDRILKGEKPAELPVQMPTKYLLVQSPCFFPIAGGAQIRTRHLVPSRVRCSTLTLDRERHPCGVTLRGFEHTFDETHAGNAVGNVGHEQRHPVRGTVL
jgi:hypothetical protein